MTTNFLIKSINPSEFEAIYSMSPEELKDMGIKNVLVDANPGYPCRLSLEDAQIGEEVLLLNYEHHRSTSPYRSSGPIYIRRKPKYFQPEVNETPKMLHHRLLSLRSYDAGGMMIAASTISGSELRKEIEKIFSNASISYIHIHNAGPGCFNCEVRRAET